MAATSSADSRQTDGGLVEPEEFHYRSPQPASGLRPGFHASHQIGGGDQFREFGSLLRQPDPRRLDLRATVRDPMQQLQVRIFNQRSTLAVYLLADMTASMGFGGIAGKMPLLAQISASVALSAQRTGDAFGFIGADRHIRDELLIPPTRRAGIPWQIGEQLQHAQAVGSSAQGMIAAAERLPSRRALIFIVSDFHWPDSLIDECMNRLAGHIVIPLVVWSEHEYVPATRFGLVTVRDMETGASRLVLIRTRLKARLAEAQRQRQQTLRRQCISHGCEPLFIQGQYRAQQLTEYFLART